MIARDVSPGPAVSSLSRDGWFQHLAGQLLVGEPPACGGGRHFNKSFTIGDFPFIEPEALLIQVAEEVKGLNGNIRSFDRPFQQRPKVLDAVRVDMTVDVGFRVVDDLVGIFRVKSLV